jgi:hypothetical protein
VATNPPPDLMLAPLNGKAMKVGEWLTNFHLAFVALDPFTDESAWILETALRILRVFDQADVRVAFVCTGTPDECRLFLGRLTNELLVFADPDRMVVKGFGLERLPAFVHLAMDGTIENAAEGWHPLEWRKLADNLAKVTSWRAPLIPEAGDPGPFEGTPALA